MTIERDNTTRVVPTLNAKKTAVEVTDDSSDNSSLGLSELFADCAALVNKHQGSKLLSMTIVDVINMVNVIRPHGVYRSDDIVIVATPYGMVVSTPTREQTVGISDNMLSFVLASVSSLTDDNTFNRIATAIECLLYEYDEMVASNTTSYQNQP